MAATKKMDLLSAIEQIVEKAKDSGLSSEFYRKADKYITQSSIFTSLNVRQFECLDHAELWEKCWEK